MKRRTILVLNEFPCEKGSTNGKPECYNPNSFPIVFDEVVQ